jgi:hypothetical protein
MGRLPAVRPAENAITHPPVALAHSPPPPSALFPTLATGPTLPAALPPPSRRPVPFPRRYPLPQFLALGTMAGVVR